MRSRLIIRSSITLKTRAVLGGTIGLVLVAGLLVPAAPAAAAGGPSVPLPDTTSTPVKQQTVGSRPPDQATTSARTGNQPHDADADGAGTPTATSLAPSATWDVSPQTGDFSWSYPLRVPPSPGGLDPTLALAYRSSAVDGRTSATNNQSSWIGDGWDLSVGFVERTYDTCVADEDGDAKPKTGDLCWKSDNATAAYGSGGGMLVRDDQSGKWHAKNDDGSRIDHLTGVDNGTRNQDYWRITTLDGTQYFFGSQGDSGATWTAPVYGDDTNEPCHASTFEASSCIQAWRWNLDKVVDRHGNVVRYYYDTETNSYGQNLKNTAVSYIRGGYLKRIDYGMNNSASAAPTGRVDFGLIDRCVPGSDCDLTKPDNWPDTPLDARCVVVTCTQHSPSFWITKRLNTITTSVWRGSEFTPVDRWTLEQLYPTPSDSEKPALWLKSIGHTGLAGSTPIAMPPVSFEGTALPNRVYGVDGLAPLYRYRITGVISENGGITSVTYAPPDCTKDTLPTAADSNTKRCFPVTWTPKNQVERKDYFHKYVVAQIVQSDRLTVDGVPQSTSTQRVTSYEYPDGAAWHWDTSEFTKEDKKTWNEFRGFGRVLVRTGVLDGHDPAGPATMSEQKFYRGMNGDKTPTGTRPVTLTDSEGGTHPDEDWLQGFGYESTSYEHEAASPVSDVPYVDRTITDPVWQGPTATRGAFKAYAVRTGKQREFIPLKAGGRQVTSVETSYDSYGRPVSVDDRGDLSTVADDQCDRTEYADNTTDWLLAFPYHTETVATACDKKPVFPDQAISDTRVSYDNGGPGAAPTIGDVRRTEIAASRPVADPVYITASTAHYDAYGRMVDSTDAMNNTTRTAFSPAAGGPLTGTTVTSAGTSGAPHGLTSSTTFDPAFGNAVLTVDPNDRETSASYDALGRTTEVWLPNRPQETNTRGSYRFSYLLRNDAPTTVTTTKVGPNGVFTSSKVLLDGFLRVRQTQEPAVGGGRLIVDTRYDSQGRGYKTTQPYFNDNPVDDNLWVAADTDVPGLTKTLFDGAGRPTASIYQAGAIERWRTTTEYGGDRVSVTPPAGGTATTTINDARGQMIESRQYVAPTPTGDYDATSYRYTPAGDLSQVTGPDGAIWKYGYDLRGRKVTENDPDSGLSAMTYDNSDRLLTTRDARGATLAYEYDALDRKTDLHQDSVNGTLLDQWTYDTATNGKGLAASATSLVAGKAYTATVGSYTALNKPVDSTITIPSVAGSEGLAGTYTTHYSYGSDGTQTAQSYPALGDLPEETVNHTFDDYGRALTTTGLKSGPLATATDYTRYGELARTQLGASGKRVWVSSYYDTNTRRLNRSIVDAEVPAPMQSDTRFTYNPAGQITSIADVPLGQSADIQCFQQDYAQRLTDAWTPQASTGCGTDPSLATLGGPAPYWQSFQYDKGGNRQAETRHSALAPLSRTYGYPAPGKPQPHTLQTVTNGGTGGAIDSYDYDPAGNTTSRTRAGASETLNWDTAGHLASSVQQGNTTSYVYTPSGRRLIETDPNGATLYLDNQELRVFGKGTVPVASRYYDHAGQTVALRRGNSLTWSTADYQGTAQIAIDSGSMAVTRRRQLPFGGSRGESVSWPDTRGFLGGTTDSDTGLTHLGARDYDSSTGRFLSDDPISDSSDPQQLHGYAYSSSDPINSADPTGLIGTRGYRNDPNYKQPGAPAPVIAPPPPSAPGNKSHGYRNDPNYKQPQGSSSRNNNIRGYRNNPSYRPPVTNVKHCGLGPVWGPGCDGTSDYPRCSGSNDSYNWHEQHSACKPGENQRDYVARTDHEISVKSDRISEERINEANAKKKESEGSSVGGCSEFTVQFIVQVGFVSCVMDDANGVSHTTNSAKVGVGIGIGIESSVHVAAPQEYEENRPMEGYVSHGGEIGEFGYSVEAKAPLETKLSDLPGKASYGVGPAAGLGFSLINFGYEIPLF